MREQGVHAFLCFRISQNDLGSPILLRDGIGGLDRHNIEGITGLIAGHAVADINIIAGIRQGQRRERQDEYASRQFMCAFHVSPRGRFRPIIARFAFLGSSREYTAFSGYAEAPGQQGAGCGMAPAADLYGRRGCLFGCGSEPRLAPACRRGYHRCRESIPLGRGTMRIAKCGLVILLVLPAGMAVAQQQQPPQQPQTDSLAAAARRARAQNKEKPKAAIVWNDDNISSTKNEPINILGHAAPADEDSSNPPATSGPAAKPAAAPANKASLDDALKAAKASLESLQTDLDLLQRKYTLDQMMYDGNPNSSKDKSGAAQLQDDQDQIDAKQQEVADAQKKVDDLLSQLDAASSDSSSDTSNNTTGTSNAPK